MMTFMDAVYKMVDGNRVIRKGWSGFSLYILPNQDYIWAIGNGGKTPSVINYTPTLSDLTATDWIVN